MSWVSAGVGWGGGRGPGLTTNQQVDCISLDVVVDPKQEHHSPFLTFLPLHLLHPPFVLESSKDC